MVYDCVRIVIISLFRTMYDMLHISNQLQNTDRLYLGLVASIIAVSISGNLPRLKN